MNFFGLDPLTIGVGIACWIAFTRQSDKLYGVLTPERDECYRNAMEFCKDPDQLRKLANIFTQGGLKTHAKMLKLRADWRARSPQIVEEHKAIFERAMKSTNIEGIATLATAFQSMTATVMAKKLMDRIEELKNPKPVVEETKTEEKPAPKAQTKNKNQRVKIEEPAEIVTNGVSAHDDEEEDQPQKKQQVISE